MHLVEHILIFVPKVSVASDSTPETNILNVILVMWLLSLNSLFQKKWIQNFYETEILSINNQNETLPIKQS